VILRSSHTRSFEKFAKKKASKNCPSERCACLPLGDLAVALGPDRIPKDREFSEPREH
jgi:hypothetical protein